MTSPSPTPAPGSGPSPASGATSTSTSTSGSGSASPLSTPISTAPPGPLSPDAQAAMQSALVAEQAAVWAYALVAAHARDQS
ncbi:hypothetical protein, partial [Nakamurella sp.]|uniref:hypothetical protein n=1 Tax=Nakamurella sp. TaxID=1869182 RepID=UPI003B3A341E